MTRSTDLRQTIYFSALREESMNADMLLSAVNRELAQAQIPAVSLRTVQDDLKKLVNEGLIERIGSSARTEQVPRTQKNLRVFYRLPAGTDVIPLPQPLHYITEHEVLALRLARDMLTHLPHTDASHSNPLTDACEQLLQRCGLDAGIEQPISVAHTAQQAYDSEHLMCILRCMRIGDALRMTYTSLSSHASSHPDAPARTYHVQPIRLMYAQEEFYMLAWHPDAQSQKGGTLKSFKLFRIQTVEQVAGMHTLPSGLHAEARAYVQKAFRGVYSHQDRCRVVVVFDKSAIPFIKGRTFGDSQTVEPLDDNSGSVRLSFNANMAGLHYWITGFGAHVVVEEPQRLRDFTREEAQRMLDLYQ